MMRSGMAVRHAARPEWGVGELVSVDPDHYTVRFLTGPRTFARELAATMLTQTDEPIPPTPRRASAAKIAASKCKACGKLLRTAVLRHGESFKACPSCSAAHGSEHILRRYPEEFVVSEAPEAEATDASHSHCIACRAKEKPASAGRLCSSFD